MIPNVNPIANEGRSARLFDSGLADMDRTISDLARPVIQKNGDDHIGGTNAGPVSYAVCMTMCMGGTGPFTAGLGVPACIWLCLPFGAPNMP